MPHDAPCTTTFRAGAFNGEKSLARPHLAVTRAGRTGLRLAAGFRAAAAAGLAHHQRRHVNLRVLAAIGVVERDLHVVAQIPAAILASGAFAAHEFAEQVVEHIGKGSSEIEALGSASAAVLEGGMAEAVIS